MFKAVTWYMLIGIKIKAIIISVFLSLVVKIQTGLISNSMALAPWKSHDIWFNY